MHVVLGAGAGVGLHAQLRLPGEALLGGRGGAKRSSEGVLLRMYPHGLIRAGGGGASVRPRF